MADEDRVLAASFFSHLNSVFLLIETGQSSIAEARFCFWAEAELFDWPVMLFPFDAGPLAIKEDRRRSSVVRESPEVETGEVENGTVSPPETQPVSPADHRRESIVPEPVANWRQASGRRWLPYALATALAASLLVGAFLYFRRASNLPVALPAAAAPVSEAGVQMPLGLAVEKRGSDLLVSWNGNSPVISKANFGMLLIRGNEVSRDVPLTAEELRTGRVVYTSAVDQVRFQLNVIAGEQVARESLAVVLPPTPGSRASLSSSPVANSNERTPRRQPSVLSASVGVRPRRELRQFRQVEKRYAIPAAPPRIAEPPILVAAPVISGALSLLNPPPVSVPAPASAPVRMIPQLLSAEAHAPVATHQVIPAVPTLLKGVLSRPTAVEVKVSVDASGGVTKAEAVATPGLHTLWRDAAVQAARRWQFQPAEFNGHPVPANIVLQFNFAAAR